MAPSVDDDEASSDQASFVHDTRFEVGGEVEVPRRRRPNGSGGGLLRDVGALLSAAWGVVFGCFAGCVGKTLMLRDRKLRVLRILGEGGFSFVYLVRDARTGQEYACKRILAQTEEQSRDVRWEVEVHRAFDHPHILRLEDYAFRQLPSGEEAVLLFPACLGGTLHDLLMARLASGAHLEEDYVLRIFRGVCIGVQQFHAHSPPWAHRDLKPGNVLLEKDGRYPVLMDFGSCTVGRVHIATRTQGLRLQEDAARNSSMAYRAPELWDVPTDSSVDEKSDVWSLGCMLFAMSFGLGFSPFECQFGASGLPQITECTYLRVISRVPWPPSKGGAGSAVFSSGLVDLIQATLKQKAAERPSVKGVLEMVDALLISEERGGR